MYDYADNYYNQGFLKQYSYQIDDDTIECIF